VWALFATTSPTEIRISVDIRTLVNTSVVSCPLYFPQFILVYIVVSCVKFELLPYTCTCYISLNYMFFVHIGEPSIFRICA
jgi:hypothetical protein